MISFANLNSQLDRLRPAINERISQVLAHGKYIGGPEVEELEARLGDYVGVKHCIGVANGTDAIQLAVMALDIKPGDNVIVPDFSYIAAAEVLSLLGIEPIFVDVDPRTYCICPAQVAKAITSRTKAIITVDLYGHCADYSALQEIAERHSIPIIEDAAQAMGASQKGRRSGAFGTIATTSFFPTKPLGCFGDGGACFTDSDELAASIRRLKAHGQTEKYHHVQVGINSRLDTIQAAILLAKLAIFDEEVAMRQSVASRYRELLEGKIQTPSTEADNTHAWGQFTIEISNREEVRGHLTAKGIPTAIHYPMPSSSQPAYAKIAVNTPNTLKASQRVLSLPMNPYLSRDEQEQVVREILAVGIE